MRRTSLILWGVSLFLLFVLVACQNKAPGTAAPAATTESYPAPAPQVLSPTSPYPGPAVAATSLPTYNPYPQPGEASPTTWEEAQQMILNGEVSQVIQTHALEVTLTLKDGRTFKTTEPAIDDVMKVIQTCGDKCKDIQFATE